MKVKPNPAGICGGAEVDELLVEEEEDVETDRETNLAILPCIRELNIILFFANGETGAPEGGATT